MPPEKSRAEYFTNCNCREGPTIPTSYQSAFSFLPHPNLYSRPVCSLTIRSSLRVYFGRYYSSFTIILYNKFGILLNFTVPVHC